ncbi:MAG: PKD domain-containing protein, partial [Ilumatobacteraceae bacterium]
MINALDIDIPSYNDQAMKILQMMSCEVAKMHEDIEKDPPDPELYVVSEPVFTDVPDLPDDPEAALLLQTLDRQAAHGMAARQAFERYQGAVEAGDLIAQRLQAATIGRHATAFTELLRASAVATRAYATVLAADPTRSGAVIDSPADLAQIVAVNERVTTEGFTTAEIADLTALGLTVEEIANVRTWFAIDSASVQVGVTLPGALEQLAGAFDAAVEPTDRFARNALAISTADLAPPTATAHWEYVGEQPYRTFRLTADAESPDGDPLAYTWDFGDGATATGRVVEHTYTTDGTFNPTVTVRETPAWGSSTTAAAGDLAIVLHSAPSAITDHVSVVSGAPTDFNPLANDTDGDTPLDQLVVVTHGSPSGGSLVCAPNGDCTYTASPSLVGTETIAYTMSDGTNSSTGSIVVTIVAPNAPTASNMSVFARANSYSTFEVPALDPDPGPDELTVEIVTPPSVVQVTVGPGRRFSVYDPDGTATTDSFAYRVFDGAQYSDVSIVSITLATDDLPPSAADVAVSTPAGVPVELALSGTDPEGNQVSYATSVAPSGAVLTGSGPTYVFDPDTLPAGEYTMTYTVSDGWNLSEPATISITVQPPPGGPIVRLGPDVELDEGQVTVSAISRDPEGGPLEYVWDVRDVTANVVATSTSSTLSQHLVASQYDVTLTVTDGLGRSASDTVGLRLRNVAPVVREIGFESHAGNEGSSDVGEPIRISARWTDPGNDISEFRWTIDGGPPIITTTEDLEHTFSDEGVHTIQVSAVDGHGAIGSAARTIDVAPIAVDAGPDRIVPEGTELSFQADPDVSPTGIEWDFGDGSTSPEHAPRHRWSD